MRYLIITYYKKANGQTDEAMTVTKNLKARDIQTANVILDFKKLEVTKASMSGAEVVKDFDTIVAYYMQHYEKIITRLFNENGYTVNLEKTDETTQSTETNPG
jgi:septum formation inhibitor-activating ATPase MinD